MDLNCSLRIIRIIFPRLFPAYPSRVIKCLRRGDESGLKSSRNVVMAKWTAKATG